MYIHKIILTLPVVTMKVKYDHEHKKDDKTSF